MANKFDPAPWTNGVTVPAKSDFVNIAADIQTRGSNLDGAGYGYPNSGFQVLVPGALPGASYAVTAASWAASVATLTIGAHLILVNQRISVSSVIPGGYNGSAVVTAVTGTTISYALTSNPGAYTSGGSVLVGGLTPANGMLAVDQNGHLQIWNGAWVVVVDDTVGWTAPTLLNSWVNFATGFETAGYRKNFAGRVELKGLISTGTTTVNTPLFFLPAGYRPSLIRMFNVITNSGPGRVDVYSSGGVLIVAGGNGFLSLEGISFTP